MAAAEAHTGQTRPPVDPFALPTGTTIRFFLLAAAILASSATIYVSLYDAVRPERMAEVYSRCVDEAGLGQAQKASGLEAISAAAAASNRLGECTASLDQSQAVWALSGLGLLVVVTVVIYTLLPSWIIRRGRLAPLAGEDTSDLVAYLGELVRTAGLQHAPTFLLAPFNRTPGGMAFGRWRRAYVRLNAGLVPLFRTDRAAFRAVVLHELAHLRNRDVYKTYLTIAGWRAFLLVALLPLALSVVVPLSGVDFPGWGWSGAVSNATAMLALTGLVYFTRNAVLRARETYADARAVSWAGADPLLTQVTRQSHTAARSWHALLRTHPDPGARERAINEPGKLLQPGRWEMFGAGMAAALLVANLKYFLAFAVPVTVAYIVVWLGCTVLIAGFLGLAVWRAAVGAAPGNLAATRVVPAAVSLGLGFLLGEQVALINSILFSWDTFASPATIGALLVSATLLLAGLALLAGWTASNAAMWLPHLRRDSLRRPCVAALAAGAAASAPLFAAWFVFHEFSTASRAVPSFIWLFGAAFVSSTWLVFNPVMPFLILLWLTPLLAAYRAAPRYPADEPAPRVGRALWAGMAGGCGFFAVVLVLYAVTHAAVPADVLSADGFLLSYRYLQIGIAVLAQAIVAAVVAGSTQRLGVILGLLGASVTAALAAVSMLTAIALGDCVGPLRVVSGTCGDLRGADFAANIVQQIWAAGTPVALCAGLLGAAVRPALHRRADVGHDPRPAGSPGGHSSPERPAEPRMLTLVPLGLLILTALTTTWFARPFYTWWGLG